MTWVSNENDYLEEEPMILAPVSVDLSQLPPMLGPGGPLLAPLLLLL